MLAKEHRLRDNRNRGQGKETKLPLQVATVQFRGTSYHGNIPEAAQIYVYGTDAEKYIAEKNAYS